MENSNFIFGCNIWECVRYLHIMGGFGLNIIAMTFCVILGLFILGRLALYVLKMRICGARFSVARLRETIFAFFVLILKWFSWMRRVCQEHGLLSPERIYHLIGKDAR